MEQLRKAEASDHFQQLCAASPLNTAARASCSYTPWTSQEVPETAARAQLPPYAKIVVLHPSAEGGMPHTRANDVICIPAYYPAHMMDETLRHEAVHLSQRSHPADWKTRASKEGWFQVDDSEIPRDIQQRCRLNPDTCWSRFWALDGRFVPLPMFVREDKPSLRDIAIRWYDRSEGILRSVVPSVFTDLYGKRSSSEMEHPFELWAYDPRF
jgi:hypothetical protein